MATLLLAISFPADDIDNQDVDPDQVADELVHMLNQQRFRNGCPPEQRLMVHAIPAPQWLTTETLANLRQAADPAPTDPRAVEHMRHLTDGRWHDDCRYCRLRRAEGGTGVQAADPAPTDPHSPAFSDLADGLWEALHLPTEDIDRAVAVVREHLPYLILDSPDAASVAELRRHDQAIIDMPGPDTTEGGR